MVQKFVNGIAAATLLAAGAASAQTTTATTTSTTTPGIPNTGAGDIVLTALILGVSAMVAVGGALYLYVHRRALNS